MTSRKRFRQPASSPEASYARATPRAPMGLSGREFNMAAEKYYREDLRKRHIEEALPILEHDFMKMDSHIICGDCLFREGLASILSHGSSTSFLANVRKDLMKEEAPEEALRKLIHLTLLTVYSDIKQNESELRRKDLEP